jgi:hypothetical protein
MSVKTTRMMTIAAVLVIALLFLYTVDALPKGNPYYVGGIAEEKKDAAGNKSKKYYLIYHHDFAMNWWDSRLRCQSIPGGDLADVPNEIILDYLAEKIMNRPAFIKSFNGTSSVLSDNGVGLEGRDCLAIYPGSIIAGKSFTQTLSLL